MGQKQRADKLVVKHGLAETRRKAQALIMAGMVTAEGKRIEKPGQEVDTETVLALKETLPYVGRGGLKLEEALDYFHLNIAGRVVADLGASTGGFTDCLLQRGARRIYAVDVDPRQLDWTLRQDSKVTLIKKNARYLGPEDFEEKPDFAVMDLSFISLLKVLPAVKMFLAGEEIVALIKPQFEAGKNRVGKKGVIRDPQVQTDVLSKVITAASAMDFSLKGLIKSSTPGQKGNREFFALWTLSGEERTRVPIETMIKEAVGYEKN
jgi:23S rRNA (cytidine1920-2'-O)/16S rRNA (cytidine1409-2'-O)-methyltransferase